MKSIQGTANYKLAIKKAYELIQFFGYEEPPIDPIKIAQGLGIKVYFAEFNEESDKLVSGFFNSKENAIYVNKNEFTPRQTFTIAHELGHHQLHREWAESKDYKILYREQLTQKQTDFREQEANTFSANLLVPKFILNKYKNVATISELATLFVVSEPVIKYRLMDKYEHEYGL
jgi:Zn-dependent peptidase ImmA (M78 family)